MRSVTLLLAAMVVVVFPVQLLLVSGQPQRVEQQPSECVVVDSACLTNLALTAQQNPGLLSNYKNVSSAVLSCVGAQSGPSVVVRPLRLLAPDYSEELVRQFFPLVEQTIGWQIDVHFAPAEKIGAQVLDTEATGRAFYDGWITETSWIPDLASQGMIEPLDNYVNADPEIEWLDVARFMRTSSAVFNDTVVGVPIGGSMYLTSWRKDVLARAGLSPPETWRDVIAVAKALNGTDFNSDGQADYALCLDTFHSNSATASGDILSQILASYTQTQGSESGWLFSPDTMETFVDSPAMTEALELVSQMLAFSSRYDPDAGHPARHPFVLGACAVTFAPADVSKASQLTKGLKGLIGSAPLPGSDVVLERVTGKLVACSRDLCPHATWVNSSSTKGGEGQPVPVSRLVNHASYSPYGSVLGMVNANTLSIYKAAIYRLFALLSSYKLALQVSLTPGTVGPYRQRILSRTNASLALWASYGYNRTDVAGYLAATQATLDSPNNALDLRIQRGMDYRLALSRATQYLIESKDVATVQSLTSRRFAAITATTPLQQLGDVYLAGLNVKRRFVLPVSSAPPQPPQPPQAVLPAMMPSAGGSSTLDVGQQVGIIIGSVVAALLVAALVAGLVVTRGKTHRRWGFFGNHLPPGVGQDTTLVVTDIENSTLLWEKIPQELMNVALEMHHTLVRQLLVKHRGYESATEGDSFIAAFHTPMDALQFTQAFQAGLLSLDWPEQVLDCEMSRPVWVQPDSSLSNVDISTRPSFRLPSPSFIAPHSLYGTLNETIAAGREASIHNGQALHRLGGPQQLPACTNQQRATPEVPKPRPKRHVSFAMRIEREEFVRQVSKEDDSFGRASSSASLQSQPATLLSSLEDMWAVCEAPLTGEGTNANGRRLVYRGLRVRVGLHSGLDDPRDAVMNATTGRMQYTGLLLYTAKAVGDCGHGGMVLLSHACFSALPSATLQNMGSVLNMGEVSFTKAGCRDVVKPGALYQVVSSDMQPRLALLDWQLRSVTQLQVGVLQAPVHHACIVFANVVGAGTLMAWDADVASKATDIYQCRAVEMLLTSGADAAATSGAGNVANAAGMVVGGGSNGEGGHEPQAPGYVVELAGGLCLAAFQTPVPALIWALRLVQDLLTADWDPELLTHELCEEVRIGGGRAASAIRATRAEPARLLDRTSGSLPLRGVRALARKVSLGVEHSTRLSTRIDTSSQVLFRGLRLKIGVDMGSVHAKVNPCTGRMAYRGRVMNRAARIADKAGSGQVWCSKAVVDAFESSDGMDGVMEANPQGSFNLKGVTEPVDLMQCVLMESSQEECSAANMHLGFA